MPKQKAPKGAKGADAPEPIADPRFASFATDPRFRLPSKKHSRTQIDKRFGRMFTDEEFVNTAKVDRYGRKLDGTKKKEALKRLYAEEEEEKDSEDEDEEEVEDGTEVEDDDVIERELAKADRKYDPARHGGFESSSDEEEEEEEEDPEAEVEEEEFPDLQAEATEVPEGEITNRFAVVNMDWDNVKSSDLMAVFTSFVKPGGRIEKISVYPSEFGKERMEREEVEGPPRELFAKKSKVDEDEEEDDDETSDEEDELEDEEEDEEALDEKIRSDLLKEDKGEEVDTTALRKYQLERLRYYYAVVICSDKETASHIYNSTDGTEYLSSANFFDLRFIPDDVTFDDKPRDECTTVPEGYRPTEFVTDALQHSKVKLTWDADDNERKETIKRAFTGSRAEIGENDLKAYLASDSEDDDEEEPVAAGPVATEGDDKPKLSKKELARQRMRAALGLTDEDAAPKKKDSGPVGDMVVSFTPGLSDGKGGSVFENEPAKEETTAEKYIRKEKERKARRKEKAKALREGRDPDAVAEKSASKAEAASAAAGAEALGFDDPFFTSAGGESAPTEDGKKKRRTKEERLAHRAEKQAAAEIEAREKAKLEKLMDDDTAEVDAAAEQALGVGVSNARLQHFDIKDIERAAKVSSKASNLKGKKMRAKTAKELEKIEAGGKLQREFEMDVGDERFRAVFERHEFAIDPSNPRFMNTPGMKALLEESRVKRQRGEGGEGEVEAEVKRERSRKRKEGEGEGLKSLVESVKKRVRR